MFGSRKSTPAVRSPQEIDDDFLIQYYGDDERTWRDTRWFGAPTKKCPMDMWVYQEILYETKPDLIIEAGTDLGGSALFFATFFDLFDNGQVVSVDVIQQPGRPSHPRVTYLDGSSVDPGIVADLTQRAQAVERVMVVLDSDHSEQHVYNELEVLAPLVTPGCYLVVEDTIVNGNPVLPDYGPGPGEAIDRWFAAGPRPFVVDPGREKFHTGFNRGGYLLRTS
jgi:cephalosporin hydroxylase